MLGAAHACANPLTAKHGIVHGFAVGLMLPHVIRFNAANGENPYARLMADAEALAVFVERILAQTGVPTRLQAYKIGKADVEALAADAVTQWTARFNPRPVDSDALAEVYRLAM
jgi:alcohol dehydrogenase